MADYDMDATAQAKTAPVLGERVRAKCGTCSKPMYREPYFPGAPTEWRHVSSGKPISWNPTKHLASRTRVEPHTHRFVLSEQGMDQCSVSGCEAEMQHIDPRSRRKAVLTGREAATQASRQRGAAKGGEAKKKAIPF